MAECTILGGYAVLPNREAVPRAKAAALRALEIDPTLGEPHATLGGILTDYEWDFKGAEAEFQRAFELSPGYATAHQWYAESLLGLGRFEEAEKELSRARELDPLSLIITRNQGLPHFLRRDYDRAIEHFRRAVALDPDFAGGHLMLGWAHGLKGEVQAAVASFERARALEDSPLVLSLFAWTRARAGERAEARRILEELLKKSRERWVPPVDIACVYAGLGEKDEAFAWLAKAYEERSDLLINLKHDPRWDNVRSDPRFADLVRRIGIP